MPPPLKLCPRCGLESPVAAGSCARCGHAYRTDFGAGAPPPPPGPRRPPLYALFTVVGALALLGLFGTCAAQFAALGRPRVAAVRDVSPLLLGCSARQVRATFGEPQSTGGGNVWSYPADNGGRVIVAFGRPQGGPESVAAVEVTDQGGAVAYYREVPGLGAGEQPAYPAGALP